MDQESQTQTYSEFMESTAPNQLAHISSMCGREFLNQYHETCDVLLTPEIQLHCPNENCNGTRFFRCVRGLKTKLGVAYTFIYITYRCSNCQKFEKTYSLAAKIEVAGKPEGQLYKFGELPTFGPPTPPKLMKLIGPDREVFLKGRRCENQGLGIGAFIYYRRVVESQRNRILSEIIKVSEKLSAPDNKISILKAAVAETQFSKSLDMAQDVLPESLLINGHSPIKLLHAALSDGVHNMSDEQCMTLATSIRIVLVELAERLSQSLKDEAELTRALSTLLQSKKVSSP